MSASRSAIRTAPRECRMFSSTARYSRASSVAAGEAGGSTMVSAWTQRAWLVPGTAGPMAARSTPRTTTAFMPPGSSPVSTTSATTPTSEYRPSMWGTIMKWPSAEAAASTAARASSDSRAIVNIIPGSTTPEVSGNSGKFWLCSAMAPPIGSRHESLLSQQLHPSGIPGTCGQLEPGRVVGAPLAAPLGVSLGAGHDDPRCHQQEQHDDQEDDGSVEGQVVGLLARQLEEGEDHVGQVGESMGLDEAHGDLVDEAGRVDERCGLAAGDGQGQQQSGNDAGSGRLEDHLPQAVSHGHAQGLGPFAVVGGNLSDGGLGGLGDVRHHHHRQDQYGGKQGEPPPQAHDQGYVAHVAEDDGGESRQHLAGRPQDGATGLPAAPRTSQFAQVEAGHDAHRPGHNEHAGHEDEGPDDGTGQPAAGLMEWCDEDAPLPVGDGPGHDLDHDPDGRRDDQEEGHHGGSPEQDLSDPTSPGFGKGEVGVGHGASLPVPRPRPEP